MAQRLPKGRRSREYDVMELGSASRAFGNFLRVLRAAEAQEQQAPHRYRRIILSAFGETNDALVGSQTEIEEVAMQVVCVDAPFVGVCRAVGGGWVHITGPLAPRPPGMAAVTSVQ
jgi:hypothetical protein